MVDLQLQLHQANFCSVQTVLTSNAPPRAVGELLSGGQADQGSLPGKADLRGHHSELGLVRPAALTSAVDHTDVQSTAATVLCTPWHRKCGLIGFGAGAALAVAQYCPGRHMAVNQPWTDHAGRALRALHYAARRDELSVLDRGIEFGVFELPPEVDWIGFDNCE